MEEVRGAEGNLQARRWLPEGMATAVKITALPLSKPPNLATAEMPLYLASAVMLPLGARSRCVP
jgi:hypothetical protein